MANAADTARAEPEVDTELAIKAVRAGATAAVLVGGFLYFFLSNWLLALAGAMAFGAVFASMHLSSLKPPYNDLRKNPPTFPGEKLAAEGFAVHCREGGNTAVYMCLTDRHLALRYFPFNLAESDLVFPLTKIAGVAAHRTHIFFPCGLRLTLRDGRKIHLWVHCGEQTPWRETLEKAINA